VEAAAGGGEVTATEQGHAQVKQADVKRDLSRAVPRGSLLTVTTSLDRIRQSSRSAKHGVADRDLN
jgi:hypothetical protein